MKDLVSVIITSYNSVEEYLVEAIKSVLQQSYEYLEVLVIDDGSKNGVCHAVCNRLSNPQLRYIRQDNKGLPAARNTGMREAQGKYICFLDDDDRWHQDKLSILVNEFKEIEKVDNKIGLIFSQCNLIDEIGAPLGTFGNNIRGDIFKSILGKNIIGPPSSVMVKRQVFEEIGYFNESFRYAEDIELWYRLTKRYTVYSVEKPLTDYRYRLNSLSKNSLKMMEFAEKALLDTLQNNSNELNQDEKKHALSKFYIDFAFLFFSDNDSSMYRKVFYKAVKASSANIFNPKLLFGYIVSLCGSKQVNRINELRGRKNRAPKDLTSVHDNI